MRILKRHKIHNGRKQLPTSLKRDFSQTNIIFAATMSAGKSSLVNALLGRELLWSSNEAATSSITCIKHSNRLGKSIKAKYYEWDGTQHATKHPFDSKTFRQWNARKEVKLIELQTKINTFCSKPYSLTLYDTPGANTSQDPIHEKLLVDALQLHRRFTILYILNATQLGTNDDALLLSKIQKKLSTSRESKILFLLNKVDELDNEKGENLTEFVTKTKKYLEKQGFINPIIIPIMAKASLIAKKIQSKQTTTRSQKHHFLNLYNAFQIDRHALNNAAFIPVELRSKIRQKLSICHSRSRKKSHLEFEQFIAYSGLHTLELYLNSYL